MKQSINYFFIMLFAVSFIAACNTSGIDIAEHLEKFPQTDVKEFNAEDYHSTEEAAKFPEIEDTDFIRALWATTNPDFVNKRNAYFSLQNRSEKFNEFVVLVTPQGQADVAFAELWYFIFENNQMQGAFPLARFQGSIGKVHRESGQFVEENIYELVKVQTSMNDEGGMNKLTIKTKYAIKADGTIEEVQPEQPTN